MSVLLECLCVVIPRIVLDVSYPGGADAYLEEARQPNHPSRYALADDDLTVVSFYEPQDVREHMKPLLDLGIVYVDENACREICVIDQRSGPVMPCNWLSWRRHPDGFSFTWMGNGDPDDAMVAWDSWTPEASRALERSDIRSDPDHAMRLSRDAAGVETWLDLQTGDISSGMVSEEQSRGFDALRDLLATDGNSPIERNIARE